jgi:hypothetical protein
LSDAGGVNLDDAQLRRTADGLAKAALLRVQDPAIGRVRVEDYLTVIAAMTGEAALLSAGMFDLERSDMTPGAPVFGDAVNDVLTGDSVELASVPEHSVMGILVRELVPAVVPLAAFDGLRERYALVARGIGTVPWGAVALSVAEDNLPSVLPIQVAFELRTAVDDAVGAIRLPAAERFVPCTLGLALALRQVQAAIDMRVGVSLALGVVFGTAKMVPMSKRAFEAAKRG